MKSKKKYLEIELQKKNDQVIEQEIQTNFKDSVSHIQKLVQTIYNPELYGKTSDKAESEDKKDKINNNKLNNKYNNIQNKFESNDEMDNK